MHDQRTAGRRAGITGGFIGLALLIAACGGAAPSAAPATPVASGVIAIDAREYLFAPAAISVAAGEVRFVVSNSGAEDHEFEILDGAEPVVPKLAIPRTTTMDQAVTLAAGTYTFACRLNGHDLIGMKGTLTVQ